MRFKTLLLAAALCPSAFAAAPSLDEANRPIYGYFNSEETFGNDYGLAEIYTGDLTWPELIYNFPENGVCPSFAGTGHDGILYSFTYVWNGSLAPMEPSNLTAYNISTGRMTPIGVWAPSGAGYRPQDATWDDTTGTLWVLGYESGQSMLMKADLQTGELLKVLDIQASQSFVTLAAGHGGELYTIGIDGVLYKLSKTTGVLTKIFDTELRGFNFLQSMEFDPTTGNILWAANASNYNSDHVILMEIDLSDPSEPTIEEVGQLGNGAIFTGLYVPGASSYDAPASPSELTAQYIPGSLEAQLSWKNPSTTYGNSPLSADELNGVVIFRDGAQIAVLTDALPGEEMTFTDTTIPQPGEYRYDVMVIGTGGQGMKATAFIYVGADSPEAVRRPSIAGTDAYAGATISWEPVEAGLHKGDFDPQSVRYTVYRRPDNKMVAENITETSVTDNTIRRTLNYWYEVVASNEIGTAPAAPTDGLILGPAFDTPFTEEFDSDREALNRWLVSDGNNDYTTWMFNSTAGKTFFGDYESALEYLVSPITGGPFNDADEWIVSGPVNFEEGKEYELMLAIRSIRPEVIEVSAGPSEIPSELSLTARIEVKESPEFDGVNNVMPDYYVTPLPTAGMAVGSVALHLCTPVNEEHYHFIQICTASIREKGTGAVVAPEMPVVLTRMNGTTLEVKGEFSLVEVFSAAGICVARTSGSSVDLSGAAPGTYIAVITTPAGKRTVKFIR